MRKTVFLTIILSLAALVSCGPRYETVKGDPLGTKIYTLDNGLKVYMSVNKEEPRIQTYIAVKVGSKNDPAQTTGLAHYFEHLMFKGTESFGTSDYAAEKPLLDQIEQLFEVYRLTTDEAEREAIYHQIDSISYEASKIAIPNEYDKLISLIGSNDSNAWTSRDETVYVENIPSNQIENWAKIQADRFRNTVIRGFHTELETVYEEKNMSLTQDSFKIWDQFFEALYPNHPYGQQTTLGSQDHLKNPSITNIKNYHDQYYVPNNIAICLSGDFDPGQMVAVIEKYFGDWEANPAIPSLEYKAEEPITEPIIKDVYGLESESITLGWRLTPQSDLKTIAAANIASMILNNGKSGLIDLNIIQAQKALFCFSGLYNLSDYCSFVIQASPQHGQSLDELKGLMLEQLDLLQKAEFDDNLLSATINNIKLDEMKSLEKNENRAQKYVDAFIAGVDWKDAARELDILASVTKEDVVNFAREYLQANSCVIIYKHQGEDKDVKKISAPAITPIVTNRDSQSAFLQEIAASEVKPIEPVFIDFSKDLKVEKLAEGVELIYTQNKINEAYDLRFQFNHGTIQSPELTLALDYISYLGTPTMSAEQRATRLYELACDFSAYSTNTNTIVTFSGLSENTAEVIKLVEDLVANAVGDETILANVKRDMLKYRSDNKLNQRSCYRALTNYLFWGKEQVKSISLSDKQIEDISSDELLDVIRKVYAEGHKVLYYGPMQDKQISKVVVDNHKISEGAVLPKAQYLKTVVNTKPSVVMAQYNAKQIYYSQYSNRDEKFDPSVSANISLYNDYLDALVFQELREARGLAYTAWSRLTEPNTLDDSYLHRAFIATQNDKMRQAIEAFDEIINNMPLSEQAFAAAKEGMNARLRTNRASGMDVIKAYLDCEDLGLSEPLDRQIFEACQRLTLDDIVAIQQKWVKDRVYTYGILGDIKDLDTNYLKTLGDIHIVSLEDIFGY